MSILYFLGARVMVVVVVGGGWWWWWWWWWLWWWWWWWWGGGGGGGERALSNGNVYWKGPRVTFCISSWGCSCKDWVLLPDSWEKMNPKEKCNLYMSAIIGQCEHLHQPNNVIMVKEFDTIAGSLIYLSKGSLIHEISYSMVITRVGYISQKTPHIISCHRLKYIFVFGAWSVKSISMPYLYINSFGCQIKLTLPLPPNFIYIWI